MFVSQTTLKETYWSLCLLTAVSGRNYCPSQIGYDNKPPMLRVTGHITDIQKSANHYFGEPVITRRMGPKVPMTKTVNEFSRIVG
jgi:hypothetical protein